MYKIDDKLFDYICCVYCKSNLKLKNHRLLCSECNRNYEIRSGIPVLIELDNLSEHLQRQILYFEKETGNRQKYKLEEWQKSYIRRFDENFNRKKRELLIDEGTGSGYIAVEMAKRGLHVIACDLTFKSLLRLKTIIKEKHLENNLFLVCCTAENLPFKNNIADYIVANAVLEHLPKEDEAIREINRVCKNKAGLMITVPLRFKYINPLLMPLNYIHDKRIGHLRRYDIVSLTRKFRLWGVKSVYYTGHFLKVIKTAVNIFTKLFNEEKIEFEDKKSSSRKWWASNICVIFKN